MGPFRGPFSGVLKKMVGVEPRLPGWFGCLICMFFYRAYEFIVLIFAIFENFAFLTRNLPKWALLGGSFSKLLKKCFWRALDSLVVLDVYFLSFMYSLENSFLVFYVSFITVECLKDSNFSFGQILIFCQLPGAQNLKSPKRGKLRFFAFCRVKYGYLEVCQSNHFVFPTSLWNLFRSQVIDFA